jgi:hypothetical protein
MRVVLNAERLLKRGFTVERAFVDRGGNVVVDLNDEREFRCSMFHPDFVRGKTTLELEALADAVHSAEVRFILWSAAESMEAHMLQPDDDNDDQI